MKNCGEDQKQSHSDFFEQWWTDIHVQPHAYAHELAHMAT